MNKRKLSLLVTAFTMLIIVLVFLVIKKGDNINNDNISNENTTIENITNDNVTANGGTADWNSSFEDLDSMESAVDLIIRGKKVDSYPEQRVDMIFTNQVIEIQKIYKGDLNIGDKIEILQTGGTLNGITTNAFFEAPLLENDGEYLLFLQNPSEDGDGIYQEDNYKILGGYQGVGLIKDDKVILNEANINMEKAFKDKKFKDIENMIMDK